MTPAVNVPTLSRWVYLAKGLGPPVEQCVVASNIAATQTESHGALATAEHGVAVALGYNSVAWAHGHQGVARAHEKGNAITGNDGVSVVSDGTASSGDGGVAVALDYGTAIAGKSGIALAARVVTGHYGIGVIHSSDIEVPQGVVGNNSILISQYRFGGTRIQSGDKATIFCFPLDLLLVGDNCIVVVRFDKMEDRPKIWDSFEGGALIAGTWYQIDVSGTPVQCLVPAL